MSALAFGISLGKEQENWEWKVGNLPSTKVKLYVFVERGDMSDLSQKVKLRRGREDMEEKAERLALFFEIPGAFLAGCLR